MILRELILDILEYADPQHPREHWRHVKSAERLEKLFYEMADYPIVSCPRCGRKHPDYDGFGMIYCDPDDTGCGYCVHLSDSFKDGHWYCDYCGAKQVETKGVADYEHKADT